MLPLPESPYGIAKYCAECYIGLYNRLHGTRHSVLRMANVYGPRQDPAGEAGVITIFCASVLAGREPTIYGDGTQTRDYVYVGDAVRAFLTAGDSGRPGTWNIGTGVEVSVLDLVAIIGVVAGRDVRPGVRRAPPRRAAAQRRRHRTRRQRARLARGQAARRGRPAGVPVDRVRRPRPRHLLTSGPSSPGPRPRPRARGLSQARTEHHPAGARLSAMSRPDGRSADQLREIKITRGWLEHAEGSVLIEFGATRVLCAASATEEVPRWRRGSGLGWVTAEYAMLPRATNTRGDRESVKGRPGGRTQEISRLVGRSLRACVDAKALGENTVIIDCDVLQADGGTRTAAITGGYLALADAVGWLQGRRRCKGDPLVASVAAVSVGIVDGEPRLDLCYTEDVAAQTDMNVVCTGDGSFVEIQGTAEREPFGRELLDELLDLGVAGCAELSRLQRAALGR